jgi:hypothetical protein
MVDWAGFAGAEPELAAIGARLFRRGIAYLGTVSQTGAPRVHPVTPIFSADSLLISVTDESPKRRDFDRDGRFALHALPGNDDEEFYLTGSVVRIDDAARKAAAHHDAVFTPRDNDPPFELLIDVCLWSRWENVGQPGTYPVRRVWKASA